MVWGPTGRCYASNITGQLVSDPVADTAIIGRDGPNVDHRWPVMWPGGWTAWRTLSAEAEVLNRRARS
jgi:hypothetical protein